MDTLRYVMRDVAVSIGRRGPGVGHAPANRPGNEADVSSTSSDDRCAYSGSVVAGTALRSIPLT
jgi:hypothetical protein